MRRRLAVLTVAAAVVVAPVGAAEAMPKPTANVVAEQPVLAPLSADALPAGAVAVLRDDAGLPFITISREQYERTHRAELANRSVGSSPATRNAALQGLLTQHWVVGELQRRRISFTERRIDRAREEIVRDQFEGWDGYRRFLKKYGYTRADVRRNIVVDLGQQAILRQLGPTPAPGLDASDDLEQMEQQQAAIDAFRAAFQAGWWTRTTCAAEVASLPVCAAPPKN
ncbi:MAG: hypothetical protein Q7T55_26070 [Solirubrobacteraceae bacterium]|nr:hypothetical protein [Solirubrobacteraceae bacterium]